MSEYIVAFELVTKSGVDGKFWATHWCEILDGKEFIEWTKELLKEYDARALVPTLIWKVE